MAMKTICDRCGKEITENHHRFFRYEIVYAKIFQWKIRSDMDLCSECADSFVKWMHEMEEKQI